jgi:hypothetical protein
MITANKEHRFIWNNINQYQRLGVIEYVVDPLKEIKVT